MVMESEKLQAALAKVRTSILLDYGELFGSEERCRQRVIDPILSALGWDIFSDEVVVEHPLPSSKGQEGENGIEEEAEKKKKPKRGAPPALDYEHPLPRQEGENGTEEEQEGENGTERRSGKKEKTKKEGLRQRWTTCFTKCYPG